MRHMFWSGFWAFIIDQASKYLVMYPLDLIHKQAVDVFPPFLVFRMGLNDGINFGLFSGGSLMRWVWILVGLGLSFLVYRWVKSDGAPTFAQIFGGMLIGGALANVSDRIVHGAVVDFLNMSCCGINNPYIFNLADVFIFIGAFGLILWPMWQKET
ncbi:MAG: signal peptidase II [Halocynthiibacter sp.]